MSTTNREPGTRGEGGSGAANETTKHATGTREEWVSARKALLEREKELTRQSDELARQRRALPWVQIEKVYEFETNEGTKTLSDLFAGRSQLLVYHFMLGPNTPAGCPGCTFFADGFDGAAIHLEHHDVTFLSASRASLETVNAYKGRMAWKFPWVSSQGSDFNRDFSAFNERDRANGTGFNFGTPKRAALNVVKDEELMALSAFVKSEGIVYHTYTCYDRGTDALHLVWQLLDRAPKGRDESAWKNWPRKHDEYVATSKHEHGHHPDTTRVKKSAAEEAKAHMGQPVVHFEVIGKDPAKLRRYYGDLFGWAFDTSAKVAQEVSEPTNYGFAAPPGDVGIPGGVGGGKGYDARATFYVGVPNVEEALKKAEMLGGKRRMGSARAPGRDLVVGLFADPEGNLIGVAGPA